MVKMTPKRIVYVSCDPATLARDLKVLSEQGYEVEKVCAVDQFSHSSHVETVVRLNENRLFYLYELKVIEYLENKDSM